MKAAKPIALAVLAAALLAVGYVWLRPPAEGAISLIEALAEPIADAPGAVAVYLRIVNDGGPDRLLGVTATQAQAAMLVSPVIETPGIPARSRPVLSEDGAYIRLDGLDGALSAGRLIPVTLDFERAGPLGARAVLAESHAHEHAGGDTEAGLFGMHGFERVPQGEPMPDIRVAVAPVGDDWEVTVDARNFSFSKDEADGPHRAGIGHGHVYVDGIKLQRIYAPEVTVGALPPGEHEIRVTLVTNDHRAYLVDDEPVSAAIMVQAQ